MTDKQESQPLSVIARAPFHVFYEGSADSVSAANEVGVFDVLPGHADFFSILIPGEVVVETTKGTINFAISNGIITVRDNQVMLFVNM